MAVILPYINYKTKNQPDHLNGVRLNSPFEDIQSFEDTKPFITTNRSKAIWQAVSNFFSSIVHIIFHLTSTVHLWWQNRHPSSVISSSNECYGYGNEPPAPPTPSIEGQSSMEVKE